MPFGKLTLRPGVDTQRSPTLNEAGISDTQMVRFPFGLPEKQGGWLGMPNLPPLYGTCGGLFGWADLQGTPYLAAGTEQRLTVVSGGALTDITPLRATTNPAPFVAFAMGATVGTVTDAGHGAAAGDWVLILVPISVAGVFLDQGYYQILTVLDANRYTIQLPRTAPAGTGGGGAVPRFTTTSGSSTVTVYLPTNGFLASQLFQVQVPTTVGGITLSGYYSIVSTTGDSFTIIAGAAASSAATVFENAGNASFGYLLPTGYGAPTPITGWGIGDFGLGDFGQGSAGQIIQPARQWSLFNYGQDLIASPTGGAIYYWQPPVGRAQVLSGSAPTQNTIAFGMGQTQIILSAGSESGGTLYPTLVRWCDSGDFTDWTPTTTNQAGSFQIPTGSTVTAGLAIGLGALVWTDVDLWSFQFTGLPYVFGVNRIAVACEALAPRAPAVIGNVVVWPSSKGFYRYAGGAVQPLPCTVWDRFFKALDLTRQGLTFSAVNAVFNEVAWFFWRKDGQRGYVRWNSTDNVWDTGILDRVAWVDRSPFGGPIGADSAGNLYQHEVGNDADTLPLSWWFQTGYFDLAQGEEFVLIDKIIPDIVGGFSAIQVTLFATDAPFDTPRVYGPFTMKPDTRYINCRVRGRQLAIKFSGTDLGSEFRLGGVRYRYAPSGRR